MPVLTMNVRPCGHETLAVCRQGSRREPAQADSQTRMGTSGLTGSRPVRRAV
jgi:hypothetical protein